MSSSATRIRGGGVGKEDGGEVVFHAVESADGGGVVFHVVESADGGGFNIGGVVPWVGGSDT